jgi:DNA-directed RNA polymerase subunit RPC12/RpoP
MISESIYENTVTLPGGLMLESHQLLKHASMRPLSGRDEEWLARHRNTPISIRVTWLLNQCLLALDDHPVDGRLVRQMLVGDREFLMMQIRRITLGDRVQAVVNCPACGSKMDVDFRLDEVPVKTQPHTQEIVTLDLHGRSVRFRLPNGGDQELVAYDPDPVKTLLDRCVIGEAAETLSADEREAVMAEMERLAPQVDVDLDLACPECSHPFALAFDTSAFFLDEVAIKADELLHEVHALAFYYHWSESEILNLERGRRRTYLALLHDALRHG